MKQILIENNDAGQRFDKYLSKLMKEAPKSFLYKMLRKKNITLNEKKAVGNEIVASGDVVKLYFSDETFKKFAGTTSVRSAHYDLAILYEDEDVIFINKPAGMLSQPIDQTQDSLVEYLIGYLIRSGALTDAQLKTFRPSVCNRLDRNTSGIVACGKSLAGLQELSELFRVRNLHKYYMCMVCGSLQGERHIKAYLMKDEAANTVTVLNNEADGAVPIETRYKAIEGCGDITLLEVELITGKTHQIRAHLASIGHPIIGDPKYGNRKVNQKFARDFQLEHQLLHAYRLVFPAINGRIGRLSGKTIHAELPEIFDKIKNKYHFKAL